MTEDSKPRLFSLMKPLTAVERQKFAERRRAMKAMDGVEERLVEGEGGVWRLEYWHGKKKTAELLIDSNR